MAYHAPGSAPIGLHYGAGAPAPSGTRIVFTDSGPFGTAFIVPPGVVSLDVLMVGGGGPCAGATDSLGLFRAPAAGGGGGGVLVQNGVAVVPGHLLTIFVGPGGAAAFRAPGQQSFVRNDTLGGITIAGPAGGGGVQQDPVNLGQPGQPANGSGAGGSFDTLAVGTVGYEPTAPDGAGFIGGDGAGNIGGAFNEAAGGGGGGADGPGSDATAGSGGSDGTPGAGGPGLIPAPSTFGPWGSDIGELGFFGGGGASSGGATAPPWPVSIRGVGGGAANTGGGGSPTTVLDVVDGFSGIVVIFHA